MSEGSVDTLLATKYLSGVALTLLLYDHVIHFDREIEFIWLEPASLLSVFVMCELWVREIGLIYIMTGFVLSFGGTIACAIRAAAALASSVEAVPVLDICEFPVKSWFETASWSVVIVYDLFVLIMVVVNALGKPRRSDVDIIKSLYTDGFLIFLAFLVLRISRLLPSIFGNGGDMLLTPLVSWALEGVLNTRLYYKIKQVELNHMHWTPYLVDNQSRTRAVLIYEETEMECI
ncbi:uncharacterized protein C8Q71DRAFT_890458 [Rhodofomes roseus]|uniref:DUF6533 domain-containing protein n=1 Tax=Rhodofomes roseus TaxID=34475 RepID=A0ABQ8KR80_9APHY|nr:uncharacterized protein C8Q71DRAFT_890458 [Rhodofomes roseus]KAH9841035.1 hypothetical protein C8Q71DRAFT_890458 [Rhodofomes roseus]